MTFRKRLKQLWAAAYDEWHQQTCCECGFTWMAVGPARPELIRLCDRCELQQLDAWFAHTEAEYQKLMKGA